MRKLIYIFLLTVFIAAGIRAQEVDVNHFLTAPAINGAGGFISNPSAYVLPHMTGGLGLHKFIFKANIGLFDRAEGGVIFDFGESTDLWEIIKSGGISFKVNALKEEEAFVSVAAGIERLHFDIFDSGESDMFKGYIVASKKADDMNFSIGVKKNLREENIDFLVWGLMADFSKVINETILVMAEYDTEKFNAGIKISLNYNINVELAVTGIDRLGDTDELASFFENHFVFGITYLQ